MPSITISSRLTPVLETGAFRLRVWVSACDAGVDPKIFVYQRKPSVPEEEDVTPPLGYIDEFVCVAAMADLSEYPPDSPGDRPFYRKYFFDIELDSVQRLGRTWDGMLGDVKDLMKNLSYYTSSSCMFVTERSM